MSSSDEWSSDEQQLSDALRRAADQIAPEPDGLARIRRRMSARGSRRGSLVWSVSAAALAAALIIGGIMLIDGSNDTEPVATGSSLSPEPTQHPSPDVGTRTPTINPAQPSARPTPQPTPQPTPNDADEMAPAPTLTIPVYYVADTGTGIRLAREFHTVKTTLPPIVAALEQVSATPAADPDYRSLWQPGAKVRSAEVSDGVINVDFESLPELDEPTNAHAELAIQQLVYTATAAAATALPNIDGALPVKVTVNGAPVETMFGTAITQPLERAEPLSVRQVVQINEPNDGAAVTSPVTVKGEGAAFEATLQWEIIQDGVAIQSDVTTAAQCCVFSPFSFDVELPPGSYQIVVRETDVSDAEGHPAVSDSKTFTVE